MTMALALNSTSAESAGAMILLAAVAQIPHSLNSTPTQPSTTDRVAICWCWVALTKMRRTTIRWRTTTTLLASSTPWWQTIAPQTSMGTDR